jgi:hypothetical protein
LLASSRRQSLIVDRVAVCAALFERNVTDRSAATRPMKIDDFVRELLLPRRFVCPRSERFVRPPIEKRRSSHEAAKKSSRLPVGSVNERYNLAPYPLSSGAYFEA